MRSPHKIIKTTPQHLQSVIAFEQYRRQLWKEICELRSSLVKKEEQYDTILSMKGLVKPNKKSEEPAVKPKLTRVS